MPTTKYWVVTKWCKDSARELIVGYNNDRLWHHPSTAAKVMTPTRTADKTNGDLYYDSSGRAVLMPVTAFTSHAHVSASILGSGLAFFASGHYGTGIRLISCFR